MIDKYVVMLDWINIIRNDNDYHLELPVIDGSGLNSVEEAHRTVKHIVENYPAPYVLYVSGGIDSQAMLWAWHTSGYEYQAVSYVYNQDMNLHDLDAGMPEFLKNHNIVVERRDIDLLTFYEDLYHKYRTIYRCGSPHICAYMYMADQQKSGTVIFSGCAKHSRNGFYTKNEWCLYNYGLLSSKSIVPFFLSETAGIHYSFNQKLENKLKMYQDAGYPVIAQNSTPNRYNQIRFSGFEQIKDYYDKNLSHLVTAKVKLQQPSTQSSRRVYDLVLRNLYELKYLRDKYVIRTKNKSV
jgi:hypothetical protein